MRLDVIRRCGGDATLKRRAASSRPSTCSVPLRVSPSRWPTGPRRGPCESADEAITLSKAFERSECDWQVRCACCTSRI